MKISAVSACSTLSTVRAADISKPACLLGPEAMFTIIIPTLAAQYEAMQVKGVAILLLLLLAASSATSASLAGGECCSSWGWLSLAWGSCLADGRAGSQHWLAAPLVGCSTCRSEGRQLAAAAACPPLVHLLHWPLLAACPPDTLQSPAARCWRAPHPSPPPTACAASASGVAPRPACRRPP